MSAKTGGRERRRHPRVPERVALGVLDGGAELSTETHNLSAAGAYCTIDRFIAPMSKLQLRFELPGRQARRTIQCSGVVVRVEPVVANAQRGRYHVAVLFTELSERDRGLIERFVRQRLSATSST